MPRLSNTPRIRKTKTALLVNAFIFPGLGHFLLGFRVRGALFALAALATVIVPLARVVHAIQTELLAYQASAGNADFAAALALAQKIWTAQGAFATFGSVALLVVWGAAIVDIWYLTRNRQTASTTPHAVQPSYAVILTPLRLAVETLEKVLRENPAQDYILDATIQRFEYTYELAWKIIKRTLAPEYGPENVDVWSRKELFRMAAQSGLIEETAQWFIFHEARNMTSHVYDEKIAHRVYSAAKLLPQSVRFLLQQLERRL